VNYLAHLYLSDGDPESLIGSLMGDFVKGRVDAGLPASLRRGIRIHRSVDSFTDAHAVFGRSRRRIRPEFRRYSGILVDLYYDHFLARQWSRYSDVPLEEFSQAVYRVLQEHQHGFPPSMRRSMSYMVRNRLLQSYRELDGIEHALRGIETRLKRPSHLHQAIVDLEENHQALAEDFMAFFPDLIRFVRQIDRIDPDTPPAESGSGRPD